MKFSMVGGLTLAHSTPYSAPIISSRRRAQIKCCTGIAPIFLTGRPWASEDFRNGRRGLHRLQFHSTYPETRPELRSHQLRQADLRRKSPKPQDGRGESELPVC